MEFSGLISEDVYRVLFELSPQPMWVYLVDNYKILDVNQAAVTLYGYSKEEFLELTMSGICLQQDAAFTKDLVQGMKTFEWLPKGISRHKKKNGDLIDVQVHSSIIDVGGRKAELVLSTDITTQLAAEKAKESADQLLMEAHRIAGLGYWSLATGQQVFDWSDQMYGLYGRYPESFVPTYESLMACVPSQDQSILRESVFPGLQNGQENNFRHRITTGSGEIRWLLQYVRFEHNPAGSLTAVKGITQDITEQVRKEKQLEDGERRFRVLVQDGADLIAIINSDGSYRFVAQSSQAILGIHPDEFMGKNAFDFIHPQDRGLVMEVFSRLSRQKQVSTDPYRFADAHGDYRWLMSIATNLAHDDAVGGIVVNSRDITEQVIRSKELELSNERYKIIMKAANEAVYDWDMRQGSVEWGTGLSDVFGYDPGSVDKNLLSDNIFTEDRDFVMAELNAAVNDKNCDMLLSEYRYHHASGRVVLVEHRTIFLRTPQGTAIRAVGSLRDITEYRQSLDKVRLQEQQLKQIAWAQSHIVRAPLARMMGLINLIRNYQNSEIEKNELLDRILLSACEVDQVIRDISDLTR